MGYLRRNFLKELLWIWGRREILQSLLFSTGPMITSLAFHGFVKHLGERGINPGCPSCSGVLIALCSRSREVCSSDLPDLTWENVQEWQKQHTSVLEHHCLVWPWCCKCVQLLSGDAQCELAENGSAPRCLENKREISIPFVNTAYALQTQGRLEDVPVCAGVVIVSPNLHDKRGHLR